MLRLGADVDTVTVTHWAEALARVPHKRRVRHRYGRVDIGCQDRESMSTYRRFEKGSFGILVIHGCQSVVGH